MKSEWDRNVYARVIGEAYYIVNNGATVRETARIFKTSKSTVHKDVTDKLKMYDVILAKQVTKVLMLNKAERHIRGGNATKEKYAHQRAEEDGKK